MQTCSYEKLSCILQYCTAVFYFIYLVVHKFKIDLYSRFPIPSKFSKPEYLVKAQSFIREITSRITWKNMPQDECQVWL